MHQKHSDHDLLQDICNSPEHRNRALRYIFLESGWREMARRILLKKGTPPADADDAISEAFIIFDRQVRAGNFDPARGASLQNYFLGIVVQADHTLRRRQKRIVFSENLPENNENSPENPETQLLESEKSETLRTLLAGLDGHCRELLRLYKLSFSMKEIRDALQISTDEATRKSAFDCRKKLFKLFEANPIFKKYFDVV